MKNTLSNSCEKISSRVFKQLCPFNKTVTDKSMVILVDTVVIKDR